MSDGFRNQQPRITLGPEMSIPFQTRIKAISLIHFSPCSTSAFKLKECNPFPSREYLHGQENEIICDSPLQKAGDPVKHFYFPSSPPAWDGMVAWPSSGI